MNKYAIRIDDRQGYKEILSALLETQEYKDVLCVQHAGKTGENIHYHICLTTDLKNQALRKRLKASFDKGKGNGHMSLKQWDGNEKALSYMFHEDEAEIIYNKGHSNDDIERYKKLNDDVKADIRNNSPNAIVSKVTQMLLETPSRGRDHRSIFIAIADEVYSRGEFFPNKFQMDRWISRVEMDLLQDDEFSKRRYFDYKYRQMYDRF